MLGLLAGLILGAVSSGAAGAGFIAVICFAALTGLIGAALGQIAQWARDAAGSARRLEIRVEHSIDVTQLENRRTREEVIRREQSLSRTIEKARSEINTSADSREQRHREALRAARSDILHGLDDQAALMESYQQLQRLVPLSAPMPRAGTWAASEDLLLWLVGTILTEQPALVVDLGSGQSSVWMAAAMREAGVRGRVIAIDHDAHYGAQTADLARAQGVQRWLEVRHAPLVDVTIDGRTSAWYDPHVFADVNGIGLVSVDGPPGQGAVQARWPALPMLRDRLAPGALVVLDDMIRQDEKDIAEDWAVRYPEFSRTELPFEKGSVVFRLG
jgi:predicted O-methyltransferase YrrM